MLIIRNSIIVALGVWLLWAAANPSTRAAEGHSLFPVQASANGHYLQDADGKPFLLHGDTAWTLLVQLTQEEAEQYLENRRQKGFNAILILLIDKQLSDNPPHNKAGDGPFSTLGDFDTPNEAYFAHADWVIQRAAEKGILVILNPCCTGLDRNWRSTIIENGPTKCRNYGRYLGNRYKNFTNIIWQAGGDRTPEVGSALEQNWLEILLGIKEQAPGHHWTAHWFRQTTAVDQPTFAPHMTLDNAYGGNRTYIQTLRAYNRASPKPSFVNEAYYEENSLSMGVAAGTPQLLRAQAYWALLSGATGHIFGSDHMWPFGGPRGTSARQLPRLDWRAGMDRQPSREMVFVKNLFDSCAWHELVPDQDHSVVTKGHGTFGIDDRTPGGDYVTAARTGDGSLVMAYVPSTGTDVRTITVDMTKLGDAAQAHWYNPTSGTYTPIDESPLANKGSREFATPGDNGTGTNDWVLVLETGQTANFSSGAKAVAKFGVHEIVLTGDDSVTNPFDTLAIVKFIPPSGEKNAKTVHAFYDGDSTWRARVYASEVGEWTWYSACSTDQGLNEKSGTFDAVESNLRGRLLPHPKNPQQWITEDGRWFLNLNDTAYSLLCAKDRSGEPISDERAKQYVCDMIDHGITSARSNLANRGGRAESQNVWVAWHFEDNSLDRLRLETAQSADSRMRMLLDEFPDFAIQLILFPQGGYGRDDNFWSELSPAQRERVLRNLVARFAAYPQIFWLFVNDAHYGSRHPMNNATVREIGAYLQQHDPWQHPRSTGHARNLPFVFGDEDWVDYVHIEDEHDLGALEYAKYHDLAKPVFLGEDRYEQDHGPTRDPSNMQYWQRRLFWSWLLSGGSANYGGRYWVIQPYSEAKTQPAARGGRTSIPFTEPLTGLDSVRHIRDYFEQRAIDLALFEPDHALVKDPAGAEGARVPKLMRRGQVEFLIYHPHAAADGQQARPIDSQAAALAVDLRNAAGTFTVEWYRAEDGVEQTGDPVSGGDWRNLVAPWKGHDCVVRLLALETTTSAHRPAAPQAQAPAATYNYDESKVPAYQLPDPLLLKNGERVTDAAIWAQKRRPEILELFRSEMYGRRPPAPKELKYKVFDETPGALGGKATRKQITLYFSADEKGPRMDLLVYIPAGAPGPVPAFLGLNFAGNQAIHADPGIKMSSSWMRPNKEKGVVDHKATEASRGSYANRWDVDAILDRGYALATAYYGDIDPDFDDGFKNGVHPLFYRPGQTKPAPDEWGSIAAWAWGLSRALDYLERDSAIDANRVVVMGHSRLGKTALWAGAEDERFAIVISNNSGCGGAALSRREFGETVDRAISGHLAWYCDNLKKYRNRVNDLPFDQHMLIALMAPRPVYVASAEKDRWSDPRGEFLSALHAEPVYRLFDTAGLGGQDLPPLDQPAMGTIGYHIRSGVHDVTPFDWRCYLDFADRHFGHKKGRE